MPKYEAMYETLSKLNLNYSTSETAYWYINIAISWKILRLKLKKLDIQGILLHHHPFPYILLYLLLGHSRFIPGILFYQGSLHVAVPLHVNRTNFSLYFYYVMEDYRAAMLVRSWFYLTELYSPTNTKLPVLRFALPVFWY